MPTTIGAGLYNPYYGSVSGATIPGDAATGHAKRLVADWVDELEPYDTPLYTELKSKATKKTINQYKVESHIARARPLTTTLAGGAYTTTGTSLNFGTTNIKYLQKGMVLKVEDEIFWTTADPNLSAGTIAVAYAQAGTSNANHAQDVSVEIIGTASPLNGPAYYVSPVIYGDFQYNYIQRFLASVQMDELLRVTPDMQYESDKLLEWIETEMKNQKVMLNKALVYGKRQEGTLASGAERPPMLGGVGPMLTTNVTTIAGSAPLSIFHVEDMTANVWSTYRGDFARTMWVSMKTKRSLNRLLNPFREANVKDSEMNLTFDVFKLETGDFRCMVDPYMPDGEIWGLNLGDFAWYTYQGQDWRIDDVEDNGTLSDQKGIVGVFSQLPLKEPLQWKITGFSTSLEDYPMVNL